MERWNTRMFHLLFDLFLIQRAYQFLLHPHFMSYNYTMKKVKKKKKKRNLTCFIAWSRFWRKGWSTAQIDPIGLEWSFEILICPKKSETSGIKVAAMDSSGIWSWYSTDVQKTVCWEETHLVSLLWLKNLNLAPNPLFILFVDPYKLSLKIVLRQKGNRLFCITFFQMNMLNINKKSFVTQNDSLWYS